MQRSLVGSEMCIRDRNKSGIEPKNRPLTVQIQNSLMRKYCITKISGNNDTSGMNAARLRTKKDNEMQTPKQSIFQQKIDSDEFFAEVKKYTCAIMRAMKTISGPAVRND